MDYRLLIARRYLASRRQVSLISIITGISVVGVALGVAALIVILSVMNGFSNVVRDMLIGLDPHIRIVSNDERSFAESDSMLAAIRKTPGVNEATAYVQGKALFIHEGASDMNRVVIVRGVDEIGIGGVSEVVEKTEIGTFNLAREYGRPGIVIGLRLGQDLSLFPPAEDTSLPGTLETDGSRVQLLSAPGIERMLTSIFSTTPLSTFEVRGLYEMEPVYDETHVYIGLQEGQRLFRMPGEVSGIEVELGTIEDADRVKRVLQAQLGDRYEVLTWYDLQRSLYEVMELEKWGASLILALIVVVAAFNIVGSLTMVVIEKRHDIGVLQAMGVSRRNIRRIFLLEGALIGLIGTGVGLAIGLGMSVLQRDFGLVRLARSESFILDAYPVSIEALDVTIVVVVSLVLCLLAAIYPAARAAAIEPAHAVQVDE